MLIDLNKMFYKQVCLFILAKDCFVLFSVKYSGFVNQR